MGDYDYRHRASDDEEFDEAAGWSDEEGEAQHPWRLAGALAGFSPPRRLG